MSKLFQPFLFMLAGVAEEQLRQQIELLKAENEMLRRRVPKKNIHLEPEERDKLLELGLALGPAIRHVITIASYSTFRRWVRKEQGKTPKKQAGRPRLAEEIRALVVRLATETGWGYTRILGELKKLKVGPISRQSVKNILIEHGFDPGPKRGKGTWSEFLEMHKETLWQIDFFSKRVWTFREPRQTFVLAFLHLGSRRVFVTPSTFKPDESWMKSQAHAFLDHAEQEKLGCSIIMRDLDGKYSKPFAQVFKVRKVTVKKVGPRAPNMNAFIERWVLSIKSESLDHFHCLGREHFDHIVSSFIEYYHECRPHQGIGNVLLPKSGEKPSDTLMVDADTVEPDVLPFDLSQIKCASRLGGLLRHYYRDAA